VTGTKPLQVHFDSDEELNAWLLDRCQGYARVHRHPELRERTVADVFEDEKPALMRLPTGLSVISCAGGHSPARHQLGNGGRVDVECDNFQPGIDQPGSHSRTHLAKANKTDLGHRAVSPSFIADRTGFHSVGL
jgi:hypothetical protein